MEDQRPSQSTYSQRTSPSSNTVLCKPLLPVPLDEYRVYYSNSPIQERNFEVSNPRTSENLKTQRVLKYDQEYSRTERVGQATRF